jgi:putative resolvase
MKSKDVLKLLKISRITLYNYVKNGLIKVTRLPNGYYNYDDKSVFKFVNENPRINVIYGRVSTYKQKYDLQRQIKNINNYCYKRNIKIDIILSDISSGITTQRRDFEKLLDMIFDHKIDTIFISNKDRLTRLSYITLKSIFNHFGTKIIITNNNNKNHYGELFEELISIMHYFSTKEYSNRKNYKVI